MLPSSTDVVVIGAGCAGLAAAVRLADAGRRVVVLEEAPRLGGRAATFVDRESGERVDNGQHVLFGCYRETYGFLDRIGAARHAPLQPSLSLSMADTNGRRFDLTCPAWTPPWHLAAGVLRWRAVPIGDRLSVFRVAPTMLAARRDGAARVAARVPASDTVSTWLVSKGQSPALRDWLWHPLAIAALNQSPEIAAAAPFVRVLGELFGPRPDDAAIGLPTVPLDALFGAPARAFIESHGGSVLTGMPARVTTSASGAVSGVRCGERAIAANRVISTVPWHAFARLWDERVPASLATTAAQAAAMASSPIVTVNLWVDGPAGPAALDLGAKLVGLVGGPMHWVFDKSAIYGDGSKHLSIVSSGAVELAGLDNDEIVRRAVSQLSSSLPALASRRVCRAVVVRERRATFSLAPGAPPRPGTRTPVSGFYLAGDWTDTGLPATIEGAVLSGHAAAVAVLNNNQGR